MFRDANSLYLDEIVEFYRDGEAVYYACRKVNANTELVCDGLAIDDGGNAPDDECNAIVSAACHAFEAVLGYGTTKCVSFYHHARSIDDETSLAMAPIERDDEGYDEEGERCWIERSELPAEAEALLGAADQAFDTAYYAAIAEVEAEHNRKADEWIAQLIGDEEWEGLRVALDNPVTCASDDVVAKAEQLLAERDEIDA
ncbi:MAG: hypothetical protein L0Z50_38550 [Verrucomicrobiales bacterium]|nr:hypothetical protein [Verrucomicrobiales bacterium]